MNILLSVIDNSDFGSHKADYVVIAISDVDAKRILMLRSLLKKATDETELIVSDIRVVDYSPFPLTLRDLANYTPDLTIEISEELKIIPLIDFTRLREASDANSIFFSSGRLEIDDCGFCWKGRYKHREAEWSTSIVPYDVLESFIDD